MAQKVSTCLHPGSPRSWAQSRGFHAFNSLGNFTEQDTRVRRMKKIEEGDNLKHPDTRIVIKHDGCFVLKDTPPRSVIHFFYLPHTKVSCHRSGM